jgi:hypothetical protein
MNRKQYEEYQASFAKFMSGHGLQSLSPVADDSGDCSEFYFSSLPCDCCKRPLGGDRRDTIGFSTINDKILGPFSVCPDCEYYAEYGQLDDPTMLDIAE